MRRFFGLVLLWGLATCLVAEAKFSRLFQTTLSAGILPFQGIGDILTNVVTYHSAYSCYQNNQISSTVALVKDLATGATSTTLGCSGPIGPGAGTPAVIAGSALATTCASTCIVDTSYDPSAGNNCLGAPCNLQSSDAHGFGRPGNPTFVANCAPNGTGYCLHFQGWVDGSSGNPGGIAATGNSYTSATGAVILNTTPVNYYAVGGSVSVTGLTGTGGVASINNHAYVVTSASAHTIGFTAASGLGTTTITGGNYSPTPQTLNNPVTFSQVNEPFTVGVVLTSDGYGNAGTSGGPNGNQAQADSTIKVGFNTTPTGGAGGPPTLVMYNGNTPITACSSGCTITTSVSYGTWYSLLAVFDHTHSNSWFCINGACTSVNLGGSLAWASGSTNNTGYSEGNGSGGWGGKWLESFMTAGPGTAGDKHLQAATICTNQRVRLGAIGTC